METNFGRKFGIGKKLGKILQNRSENGKKNIGKKY